MTRKLVTTLFAACLLFCVGSSSASASFGITSFGGSLRGPTGQPLLDAGAHPDFTTSISFQTVPDENANPSPDGNAKDIEVNVPPGLVGNPTATPKCSQASLVGSGFAANCAPESQVGVAEVTTYFFGSFVTSVAVYNLQPPPGVAGQFGFNVAGVPVYVDAGVQPHAGQYTIDADVRNISQGLAMGDTTITFWGVPASPLHNPQRVPQGGFFGEGATSTATETPLMSNPTSCPGTPLRTSVRSDSWQQPGIFHEAEFQTDPEGTPLVIDGCADVPFEGSVTARPTTQQAESPSGLDVTLRVPQNRNPRGLAVAAMKRAVVALPEGMTVNPATAGGLAACTPSRIDLNGGDPAHCPTASKLGSVEVDTPLLERPLKGAVYQAAQKDNPFGSMLALYVAVEDPATGVVLKLPGEVSADPRTGRLTTVFDQQPQVPFEELRLSLFGGPRAALLTPARCGSYETTGTLSPWSGNAPATSVSTFQITSGPGGGPCPNGSFNPKLSAGTTNPLAATHSPFALQVSREDGSEQLGSITASLPKGLLASLRGVPYCREAALASVSGNEGTGAAQSASPSCPAASQVGTVAVGAGAGPSPFYLSTGKAYLGGPYKGAPLSLAIVTPAVAGPFDLGSVVVRSALNVDPATAEITAVSDPLPTILHGIPLDLREVAVNIDRPDFTLNPSSCDPMQIKGTIGSSAGKSSNVSSRFQVTNCAALGFKPSLKLKVTGATKRGSYPKLRAELKAPAGQANIGKVSVALPHSEFLAQEHIKTICTRVQYSAKACPAGSIYGYARAFTPLLDKPLEGPVYLRSSSNPLPDLVASLDGQIHIDLTGRIDSVNGGIRNTFESVPDAPVSKFVLTMKGGKKSLLVNSRNLCAGANRATVKMDGQNGKVRDFNPVVGNSCGKKAKKK